MLVSACKMDKVNNLDSLEIIPLNPNKTTFAKLSEIVSLNYQIIPLSSEDDVLIGEVNNLIIKDSLIFILDADRTKSVFVFDMDGSFFANISDYGMGHGKYHELGNFYINSKQKTINIYQTWPAKVMEYNYYGDFINEKEIYEYARTMTMNAKGNYCIYTANVPISEKSKYNFLMLNNDFQVICNCFPTDVKNKKLSLFLRNNFTHFGDSVSFVKPFCDTIFDISEDQIKAKYLIDFGEYAATEKFYNKYLDFDVRKIIKMHEKNNQAYGIQPFYESNKYLYFKFFYKESWEYLAVFSKNTKTMQLAKDVLNDVNQMPLNLSDSFLDSNNNAIISIVYPFQLKKSIQRLKSELDESEFQVYSDKNQELIRLSNLLDNSDNPVIIKYFIKDF